MKTPASNDVLSVGQLNRLAKQLLEDCFGQVCVEGELSNLARPSSGHWYFTLKDDRAQIRCAMFKGRNFAVRFDPQPGQQLQLRGKVSLYEGRGDYQMIVDSMQPAGAGALAQAFEQLKQELQAAGWFDRKRPLPSPVRHIGVITSPTGAAIRDILSVIQRRWPAMRVTLIPAQVQGEAAAGQLVAALRRANALDDERRPDVLLLSRGGGSLEDLWPFNERAVAEAIFRSELPVVSAVGHEVDFSIADFVADLRAATPSAAAELLCPDQVEVLSYIAGLREALSRQMQAALRRGAEQRLALHRRLRHPGQLLADRAQRLDERELYLRRLMQLELTKLGQQRRALTQRLTSLSPARRLLERGTRRQDLQRRLLVSMTRSLRDKRRALEVLTDLVRKLSPDAILQRGYAIVLDDAGRALRDSRQVEPGARIEARLARGRLRATVESRSEGGQ